MRSFSTTTYTWKSFLNKDYYLFIHLIACVLFDWLEWFLWFWLYDTRLKAALFYSYEIANWFCASLVFYPAPHIHCFLIGWLIFSLTAVTRLPVIYHIVLTPVSVSVSSKYIFSHSNKCHRGSQAITLGVKRTGTPAMISSSVTQLPLGGQCGHRTQPTFEKLPIFSFVKKDFWRLKIGSCQLIRMKPCALKKGMHGMRCRVTRSLLCLTN